MEVNLYCRITTLLVLVGPSFAVTASADSDDSFEPVAGFFTVGRASPYKQVLRSALIPNVQRRCQLVALESRDLPWSLVLVRSEQGNFYLESRQLRSSIWTEMQKEMERHKGPNDGWKVDYEAQARVLRGIKPDVRLHRRKLPVGDAMALLKICRSTLLRSRYAGRDESGMYDGQLYYAAAIDEGTVMSGRIRNPGTTSLAGMFVELFRSLRSSIQPGEVENGDHHYEAARTIAAKLELRLGLVSAK